MGTLATLAVILTLTKEAYDKGLDAAKTKAEETTHSVQGTLSTIGTGLAVAGAAVATGAIIEMTKFMGESVEAAKEEQAVQSQLAAVLKSTGGAAGVTAEMANQLADSFDATTQFEADAVVGGENMLLTFTNIGKDVFPAATESMLDLSQAMGQDLKSSAIQLGKALNDPMKGMTALQRVGVTFSDQQKEQIKGFMATNDIAKAQGIILGELQKEFGGSAEAAGKTAAGQMMIFDHAMERIKETIGGAVLPVIAQVAGAMADWLNRPEVQQGIKTLAEGIGNFAMNVVTHLPEVIAWVTTAFSNIRDWVGVGIAKFQEIWAVVGPIVLAIVGWFSTAIPTATKATSDIWQGVLWPVIQTVAGFIGSTVGALVTSIQTWWKQNGDTIMSVVSTAWNFIQGVITTVTSVISSIVAAFRSAFEGDWKGFGEHLRQAWDTIWNAIKSVVENLWPVIKGIISQAVQDIINFFTKTDWGAVGRNIIEGIGNGIKNAVGWLAGAARDAANAALNAAKGFLGIQSPSTVFAEVGKNMMMGWGQGIQANSTIPTAATTNVAAGTLSAAPSGGGQGGPDNSLLLSLLQTLVMTSQLNEEKLARVMRDSMLQVQR